MPKTLDFTERMTGHFALGADGHEAGREQGEQDGSELTFVLTIVVADLDELIGNAAAAATATGYVEAPALGPGRMEVADGTFQMMVPDPDHVSTYNMRYDLTFAAADGERYRLQGHKVLDPSAVPHTWRDTSTLFTDIRRADGDGWSDVIGRGVMVIKPRDFMSQIRTFRVRGAEGFMGGARETIRFSLSFMGRLRPLYAGDLDTEHRYAADRTGDLRPLRLPVAERWWKGEAAEWHTGDPGPDAYLALTRYHGGDRGPLLLAGGYGMQADSMATPTIDTTLAEFAVERGYDVFLFDYRDSIALPSCHEQSTIDDIAKIDWPEAVAEVRRITGAATVQAFGHCVGAVSLLMAQLAGMEGVRSVVCSQFTVHPRGSRLNKFKLAIRLDKMMQAVRVKGIEPNKLPTFANKAMDVALIVVPYPRGERCGRPICRWLNSMYGLTHTHSQLNDATHETFDEAFGFGNLTGMRQNALMSRTGRAVNADGEDEYLVHPERLAIPTQFVLGRKNYIFMPEGTLETVAWLQEHNDPALYEVLDLEDYAHLDGIVGRDAARDVFPGIFDFLDRHQPA